MTSELPSGLKEKETKDIVLFLRSGILSEDGKKEFLNKKWVASEDVLAFLDLIMEKEFYLKRLRKQRIYEKREKGAGK